MVQEGVVLGQVVSNKDIEVDKVKVEVIEKFPPPNSVKDVRSFLEYVIFYRQFIKDFSKLQNLSLYYLSRLCLLTLMKSV